MGSTWVRSTKAGAAARPPAHARINSDAPGDRERLRFQSSLSRGAALFMAEGNIWSALRQLFTSEPPIPLAPSPMGVPPPPPPPRAVLQVTPQEIRADAFARGLKAYQAGREFRHHIAGHHLYEIKQWLELGLATKSSIVRIEAQSTPRAHEPACPTCAALHGKRLTIAEVLATMPLPVRGCAHRIRKTKDPAGWCRCNFRLEGGA